MARPTPIENVDADTPLAEAARRALAARLADVRQYEEPVVYRREAESVHDMRVATRRLRAAIGLFAEDAELADLEEARFEVKRLGDALGRVRDLDVQMAWLAELLSDGALPAEMRPGVQRLHAERRAELTPYEEELLRVLERWRNDVTPRLALWFGAVGGKGRFGRKALRRPLARRLRRLEEAQGQALLSPDAHTAHRLRIVLKKLRYVAELLEPALPQAIPSLLQTVAPLQETLGDLHDRDVRHPLVERFLLRAGETERAGAIWLLASTLADRDRLANQLTIELRLWQADDVARTLRRSLK